MAIFRFFWKHFPVFYTLPFLMAAMRVEQLALVGDILRWVVLFVGCSIAAGSRFKRAGRRWGMFSTVDRVALGFLALFMLSALWSIDPAYSAQRTVSMLLLYGCSFWALWRYADRFSEEMLLRKLLYTLAVVLVLNFVMGALLFPGELGAGRFSGLFENPNGLGLLVGLSLPLVAAHWLVTRQWLDLAAAAAFALSLVAAGTRSAMLGVAVALTVILISFMGWRAKVGILVAAAVVIGAALFSQTDFFIEHVLRKETLETGSNRVFFWKMAERYIERRPVLGHGFGSDALIHKHYGVVLWKKQLRGYGVMSSYYGLAVQIGWPLTCLFFGLLWGYLLRCLVKYWRQDFIVVTLVAASIGGLIVCIFEPVIYSAGNVFSFLFWTFVMLIVRRVGYRRAVALRTSAGTLTMRTRPRWIAAMESTRPGMVDPPA
jgi:O-antigen ligase